MKKKLPYILFFTGVFSLLILYIFLWLNMILKNDFYSGRTGKDFIIFYTAGRVADEHGINNTYNIALQKNTQENILGVPIQEPLPYNHLPFLIPALILISKTTYSLSFLLWVIFLLLIYVASFSFLQKKTQNKNLILSGFLFFPIFISILQGQDTAFLFLGITLIYLGIIERNAYFLGIGLALTTIRPHIALPLMMFLLFRFKGEFNKLITPSVVLALISIILIGMNGVLDYLNILQISIAGDWLGFNKADFINIKGMLIRYVPVLSLSLIQKITWAAYILNIFLLTIWQKKNKKITINHLSVALSLVILFSPHMFDHDASIMIIPLLFLVNPLNISNKEIKPLTILGITFLLIFSKSTSLYYSLFPILAVVIIIVAFKEIKRENIEAFMQT